MLQFFESFFNFIAGAWTVVFGGLIFSIGDIDVSLGDLFIAALITFMVINIYWKGGKA